MHILTVVDEMQQVLESQHAPARQLTAIRAWRRSVADAVSAAQASSPAGCGMSIGTEHRWTALGWQRPHRVRFLFGDATHRAWVDLCEAIGSALKRQQERAAEIIEDLPTTVRTRRERAAALAAAEAASRWSSAARSAEREGVRLVERESSIVGPVGAAISLVGGLSEIAQDKYYYQRVGR